MSTFSSLVVELERYPQFLRVKDLIDLNLYETPAAVSISIKDGKAPPSIRLSSRKIVFPRSELIEWLLQKAKGGAC
jgi:predicted DNA-binding transcriptional regulator AlpA